MVPEGKVGEGLVEVSLGLAALESRGAYWNVMSRFGSNGVDRLVTDRQRMSWIGRIGSIGRDRMV